MQWSTWYHHDKKHSQQYKKKSQERNTSFHSTKTKKKSTIQKQELEGKKHFWLSIHQKYTNETYRTMDNK